MPKEAALHPIEQGAEEAREPARPVEPGASDVDALFTLRGRPSRRAEALVAVAACLLVLALWEIAGAEPQFDVGNRNQPHEREDALSQRARRR